VPVTYYFLIRTPPLRRLFFYRKPHAKRSKIEKIMTMFSPWRCTTLLYSVPRTSTTSLVVVLLEWESLSQTGIAVAVHRTEVAAVWNTYRIGIGQSYCSTLTATTTEAWVMDGWSFDAMTQPQLCTLLFNPDILGVRFHLKISYAAFLQQVVTMLQINLICLFKQW